jgi:hypothetical protein
MTSGSCATETPGRQFGWKNGVMELTIISIIPIGDPAQDE